MISESNYQIICREVYEYVKRIREFIYRKLLCVTVSFALCFVIPLRKTQVENIFWIFLTIFIYNMSRRLLFIVFLFLIMLKITFGLIQSSELDYNRRQTLIKTATNAEKIAKANERVKFLINCRRKNVFPKFLQRKTGTFSDIFPNNRQVETIRTNYLYHVVPTMSSCSTWEVAIVYECD